MTSGSPEDVIRDYLSSPRMPVAPQLVPGTVGWRSEVSWGGCDAQPETMRFLKARSIPGWQVHAVTFQTRSGQAMSWVCSVLRDDTGDWRFVGGAGGAADGSPQRDEPWVNLGGGGWPAQFYAGGCVLDHGRGVVRVRLRAANSVVMEDTVDDGLILFLTDSMAQLPIEAELMDGVGTIVSRHVAFHQ
jgi:hypothetical protein